MRKLLLLLFILGLLTGLAACQQGEPQPQAEAPPQQESAPPPAVDERTLLVGTVVNATLVNIRQQPNTDSRIIDNALRGVMYRLSSAEPIDGWYEIVSHGETAYIYQDYLYVTEWQSGAQLTVGRVVNTDSAVNIRQEASLDAPIVASAGKNESFIVLQPDIAEGWHQIDLAGTPAYIGTAFLEMQTLSIEDALY